MSLPQSFKDHYLKLLPKKEAECFFEYCEKPLRKAVRVNLLKYSIDEFKKYAQKNNWEIDAVPWCNTGFFINRTSENRTAIGSTLPHVLGGIYVQEASSMLPVLALFYGHENLDFSHKIIGDLAASPGSKSTQIADIMKGKGILLTNELSSSRLKALYSNLERCGVSQNILTHYDAENLCDCLPNTFDFLLLDAPCTGEGTVRKNFKALDNWSKNDAITMSHLQKKLIRSAFTALKKGGELVYSTCTLGKEENSDVVQYLLDEFPNEAEIVSLQHLFPESAKSATDEGFLQIWPQIYDSEGFFVAKIRKINKSSDNHLSDENKKESTQKSNQNNNKKNNQEKKNFELKNFPFDKATKKQEKERNSYFFKHWGFILSENFQWWKRGKEWWVFPQEIETLVSRIRGNRIGIKMGELHRKGWKTTYEFCSSFGKLCTKNVIEISEDDVVEVYKGNNLNFSNEQKENYKISDGEVLLHYKNFSVAIGKMQKNKWKNQIPRVLLRDLIKSLEK